ncbi:hypothetical protein [Zobellia laminariae]|uniref:hypothetical protein n=1 Tax=Zobellia laminariae TaxID=248906 RepID=UPI004055C02F
MKAEKIKKGCGIALIIVIIIIIGLFWMIKTAFGPTVRTIEIDNPVGKLICEEEYNADMAAVFYDVDFKLETAEKELIDLGKLYFQREDWQTEFELKENEDWYYLSSNQSSIHDLILTDKISQENLFFDLISNQPKNKGLWKTEKYIIGLPYSTAFIIDSVKQDLLYIKYEYQSNENSKLIKRQTVEFKIDKLNKALEIIKNSELK